MALSRDYIQLSSKPRLKIPPCQGSIGHQCLGRRAVGVTLESVAQNGANLGRPLRHIANLVLPHIVPDFRDRPELGPESLMQPRAACIVVPAIAIHVYRRQKQAVQVHAEGQYRRKRPVDDARAFVRVLINQDVCPKEIAMRKNLWIIPSKESKKTAL